LLNSRWLRHHISAQFSQGGAGVVALAVCGAMDWDAHREITALVEKRERARAEKRWSEADAIRDDLASRNVQVVDRDDLWRCGPMIGLYNLSYDLKDGAIKTCLDLREEARAAKDYANADFIRDMMKDAGVELKDWEGIWWSVRDERHGKLPLEGATMGSDSTGGCTFERGPKPDAAQGGGGGRHRDDTPRRRSRSPPARGGAPHHGHGDHFSRDAPRESRGNGWTPAPTPTPSSSRAGDRGGRPTFGGAPQSFQAPPPPRHGGSPGPAPSSRRDQMLKLDDLLIKREELRVARDFEGADKVRDVLGMLGIHLNDKERRWTFPDGRSGDMPVLR